MVSMPISKTFDKNSAFDVIVLVTRLRIYFVSIQWSLDRGRLGAKIKSNNDQINAGNCCNSHRSHSQSEMDSKLKKVRGYSRKSFEGKSSDSYINLVLTIVSPSSKDGPVR